MTLDQYAIEKERLNSLEQQAMRLIDFDLKSYGAEVTAQLLNLPKLQCQTTITIMHAIR